MLRERPVCPYCGEKTIPIATECIDKSGWICGWTCNCKDLKEWEETRKKTRNMSNKSLHLIRG